MGRPVGGPYRSAQAQRLLGVGEHVLRHWERELPILSPARSPFGRREYSAADLALLFRVRHLVRTRGLTLARVLETLLAERSGPGAETAARLAELRSDLIEAYFSTLKAFSRLGAAPTRDSRRLDEDRKSVL